MVRTIKNKLHKNVRPEMTTKILVKTLSLLSFSATLHKKNIKHV